MLFSIVLVYHNIHNILGEYRLPSRNVCNTLSRVLECLEQYPVVCRVSRRVPRVSLEGFRVLEASLRLPIRIHFEPSKPSKPLNTLQNPKGSPQNTPRALQNPEGMLPEYPSNPRGYCQGYLSYPRIAVSNLFMREMESDELRDRLVNSRKTESC